MTFTNAQIKANYERIQYLVHATIDPFMLISGTVGAILSLVIFSQKTMRQNPGSMYFIAFNVTVLVAMTCTLMSQMIRNITNSPLYIQSAVYCKMMGYSTYITPPLCRYSLVLASIDRTLVTSSNALTRRLSTHHLAYWMIGGMFVTVVVFYIFILAAFENYELQPGLWICYIRPGFYNDFSTYSNLVFSNAIPWILMSGFAIKTVKNIREVRIQPANTVSTTESPHTRKNRQLTILLLSEISLFASFGALVLGYRIYLQATQFQTKSFTQQTLENCLLTLLYVPTYIPPAISFYLNLLVSKAFQRKTKEVLLHRYCRHHIRGDGGNTVT